MESCVWQSITIEDIFLIEDAEEEQNRNNSVKR